MEVQESGLTAKAVKALPAALQNELNFICSRIGREDKLSATTAQIARFDELRAMLEFDPAGTDFANLRARMSAMGGSLSRTHPDDGPVRFLVGYRNIYDCYYAEDTLAEVATRVKEEEADFSKWLDYARKLAVWKDGVAARKARKAARAAIAKAKEGGAA